MITNSNQVYIAKMPSREVREEARRKPLAASTYKSLNNDAILLRSLLVEIKYSV
jgi:hypothetical protein